MKLRFLPWLLFFIWANGFICLGLETHPAIEYENENFNISTAIFQGKEIQGLNKRNDLAAEGDAKGHEKNHDMFQSIGRGQRGKGSYGGANIAHGRSRKRSAAAFVRPDLSLSAASLALILILPSSFLILV